MHFHWNLVKMHLPHVLFLIFSLDICPFVFCVLIILDLLWGFFSFFLFIEIESHCTFQADFAELELQVSTTLSSSVTDFLKFLLYLFVSVVHMHVLHMCMEVREQLVRIDCFFLFFYFSPPCWS